MSNTSVSSNVSITSSIVQTSPYLNGIYGLSGASVGGEGVSTFFCALVVTKTVSPEQVKSGSTSFVGVEVFSRRYKAAASWSTISGL